MHRSRAYIASFVAIILLVTAMPAFAATSSDVRQKRNRADRAREAAASADSRAADLAKQATALDSKISGLQAQVDELDPSIADASARTARLRAEVEGLRKRVTTTKSAIASTTAELGRQQSLLGERVTATYKQGEWYFFSILLGSEDISDLITRTELVRRVIDSNQHLADGLSVARDRLDRDRIQLERDLEAVAAKRAEAEAVENELRGMQNARQARVDEQQSVRNQKSSLMAENKSNAKRLRAFAEQEEAEADRIAAELSSRPKGSGKYSGGAMAFPVPGGHITSGFGWRVHPIFGTKKFHKGVDIGAGSGSSVVAAGNGKVIRASYGWGGGYGNRIFVDHGDGVVTTYNHLLDGSFKVSVGTKVKRGQRIASVGSTGYSTGPHLHFEVWVNGEPRNPANYF